MNWQSLLMRIAVNVFQAVIAELATQKAATVTAQNAVDTHVNQTQH